MFQMLWIFAEFKRAMIRERVHAGFARARANGDARPPQTETGKEAVIRASLAAGIEILECCEAIRSTAIGRLCFGRSNQG
jgi:DNA invertase Pin-like site-specific DNA recombinase